MKLILMTLVLLGVAANPTLGNPHDFRPQYDLDLDDRHGSVHLSISTNVIVKGGHCIVEVSFVNKGRQEQFYNPFFNSLIPLPAMLVAYNSDNSIAWIWGTHLDGSRRGIKKSDWVSVPEGGTVGFRRRFPLGAILRHSGTYYLQVIYCHSFVTARHNPSGEYSIDFGLNHDQKEAFRSNAVMIQIVEEEPPNTNLEPISGS